MGHEHLSGRLSKIPLKQNLNRCPYAMSMPMLGDMELHDQLENLIALKVQTILLRAGMGRGKTKQCPGFHGRTLVTATRLRKTIS